MGMNASAPVRVTAPTHDEGSLPPRKGSPKGWQMSMVKATSVGGGLRTGDLVRANVPASSVKAGVSVGRLAVRASGSCTIKTARGTVQGIHVRYCQPLQRGDGYSHTERSDAASPALKAGVPAPRTR
jgi:hypothetical protein